MNKLLRFLAIGAMAFPFLFACEGVDETVPVSSVELSKTSLDLAEGEEATLTATVKPSDATDKSVSWRSSDETVVSVNNGRVKALKPGNATVTATAGGKSASCSVRVSQRIIAVTSVQLDKTSLELTEGDEATLTATVRPDDATDKTVTWTSSDATIATVANGKVTAVKEGTATITAKAGDKTATCTVKVNKRFIAVTSIELDKTSLELTEGDEAVLTATVKPDDATDKTVTWSSSGTSVATVTDGKVKAIKPGTATITAKAGDKTATCTITVKAKVIPVSSIQLDKTTLTLTEGDEATLAATVKPDNATDKTVTWTTSDATVATVADGKVTAVKEGTATITAKAGDKTATCTVTVKAKVIPVTSMWLDKAELELTEGEEATLIATVMPENATDKTVTWSTSNASVATVTDGKVKALKAGTATITAKAGDKSAKCTVTVLPSFIAVTSVTLDKATLGLVEGDQAVLTATVSPDNATDPTVTWTTSNASVATVEDGMVTAVKAGTATITAKAGEKSAQCTVTVTAAFAPVTSVTLDKTALELVEGDEATLTATVKPDNATDPTVTWTTSDASIAAVTDGKVTAVKAGTATITAKAGEKTATCTVTVKAKVIPVTSIQLDKTALELVEGDEATLTATVKPDNATDPTVTWTSSDASVAAVTDGKVTALKVGTATITAKAGEKTATCTITVKAKVIPVTSIWLDHAELELTEGDEAVLTANVLPENATDKTVTWTSSDASVATVTDGTVKAVKPGSAVITAKAGEKTAKCTVTVKAAFIPVTSVTLDKTSMSLEVGDVENLIATVKPDNATDPTVTWTTSDESVASVSDGLVTALKEGTAVITAKAGEKTATCSVTVIYVPKPVIRLQTSSVTIPGYVSSTPGSVWYTLENAPAGECVVATTDDDWIWLGTVTPTEVPYTLPSNPWTETRTGTITLSYPNADPVTFEINQYSWSYQYTVLNVPDLVREVSYEAATYNIEYTITNPLEGYGFRCTTDPYMCDWLTPNIDGDVITFTVKENKSTQSRTCEITLKYTAAMYPARINVTQAGKPAGPPAFDFDSFNPDANNGVNAEGEESCPFYVRIVNPVPGVKLEMTADVAWITNLRPLTNAQDWYCFTASRNTTGRDRYGYVQLTYGTLTRKVKFKQQAGVGIIILDPGDMTINYKARSVSFNITLPEGYNYNDLEVAPDVSYYYVKNLTRNGGRVTFDLRENNDMFDRTVGIAVRLGDQQSVFHVTQTYEAPVFSVSPASLTVGYARQSKTIDVQVTNPREELSLSVIEENDTPWLWSSSPNNVPTINFAENSTGANRTSAVLIGYSKDAMGQVRLPVMQTTANTSVDVSPTSVSCDYKGKTQTFSISISDPLESAYLKVTAANPWIEVKSITDNSATVSIHKNLWNTPRSSSITFSYGSYSTVVPVTQGASNVPAGFVDLGLPSGTLWAETNVGASVEYETGSYFAWAETASKSSFYIENYKWGSDNMKKYNESDHRTSILLEDDAAYKANPNWTIPTKAQFDELCNECIWEWVLTPVAGMKVKSKVGDTYIFLPSTGYIDEKELSSNFEGFYWTKDLYTDDDWLAHMLSFMSMSYGTGPSYRYLGMPIRAVKK